MDQTGLGAECGPHLIKIGRIHEIEVDPFHKSPIPNVHPHKLRDQILEMRANPEKKLKGISLDAAFGQMSFLQLHNGFWIAEAENLLYYPIPDEETLKNDHYDWYRALD